MKRYGRNKKGYSYWIGNNSNHILMAFGMSDGKCFDITVHKKTISSGYCFQKCFKYKKEDNALSGKRYFNIKRIVIYQMK